MSEKMDGVRAFWNGKKLISRNSKEICCPAWFTQEFPEDVKLDGELWLGRQTFPTLMGVLNTSWEDNSLWKTIKYVVFDLPNLDQLYEIEIQTS